jgi:Fe-S cluster assembly protein SufD
VWIGDVLIRKVAEGIETYESTRTSCSPRARAPTPCRTWRSRPARSPAPGTPVDDRPLRRRAAVLPDQPRHPGDEARRLVVMGFFVDIIRRIGVADIEER